MQIGIIGAGAIGGTIASLLSRAGHDVELTARGEHLSIIREQGLTLTGAWGSHVAQVEANPTLTRRPELAFICTKAQDARAAITANVDQLRGIPVVVVQNGLESLTTARSVFADEAPSGDEDQLPQWVGALALYAASYLAPGRITITTAGPTYLGTGEGAPDAAAISAAAVLDTVMPATAISNFRGAQWTKLIVNQVNAMPAITGLSAQETLAHPLLNPIITSGMREAVRIGFALGVHYGTVQGLNNLLLRIFSEAPLGLGNQLPKLLGRRMGSTPNPGSTLQSIRRGQLTEIDYLNGAVVAEAESAGLTAPVNAALVALVHEVERTGNFFTANAVQRAVFGDAR
ncbi:ketopantoate reductase family protein [Subtercola frigoramans]|uniref:2-dehydropantoate 2-reductase n=1 Tax=Subtercola frigoramans TaxID=120298 RepID=A0ABS2L4H8_9MICO|nr:2-dehydropantoate 2-reductase [Subtercola frigoramans]MBM7471982.1 2-dehydropantoate 2-reductase [Subtercola frigoramans]